MINPSGQVINLSSMCGSSTKAAAAQERPRFISEDKDFLVTDLKLKRSPAGLLVYISGKIKNVGKQSKFVSSVRLQLEHEGTILSQTDAQVNAELVPGKAFAFRDIVDKDNLDGKPLSKVEVNPISFVFSSAKR